MTSALQALWRPSLFASDDGRRPNRRAGWRPRSIPSGRVCVTPAWCGAAARVPPSTPRRHPAGGARAAAGHEAGRCCPRDDCPVHIAVARSASISDATFTGEQTASKWGVTPVQGRLLCIVPLPPCTIDLTVLAVGTRGGGALEVGLEHTKADGRAWASLAARRVHARPILAQLHA
jgi:hypothetical protein